MRWFVIFGIFGIVGALATGCAVSRQGPPAGEQPPWQVATHEALDRTQATDTPAGLAFTRASGRTCRRMRVLTHAGQVYLNYGNKGTFVRLLPDGSIEDLTIHTEHFAEGAIGTPVAVEGTWGGGPWIRTTQGFYRRVDGTSWSPIDDALQIAGWIDDSVLVSSTCSGRDCEGLRLTAFAGATAAPKFPELRSVWPKGCQPSASFTALHSGEIFAAGKFCHESKMTEPWYAVRWSPARGTTIDVLTPTTTQKWTPGPVVATGPTRAFASATFAAPTPRTLVAAFDGAQWTLLPPLAGTVQRLEVDADGSPWLLLHDRDAGDRLVRYTPAGEWQKLAFPRGPVQDFGDLRGAHAWVHEQDGALWLRPAGGKFSRVNLPAPDGEPRDFIGINSVATAGAEVWLTVGDGYVIRTEGTMSLLTPCVSLMRSGTGPPMSIPP
jgi:hypothetical protein